MKHTETCCILLEYFGCPHSISLLGLWHAPCAGYIAPILECASFKRDVAHLSDWHNPRVRIDDYTSGTRTKIRPEWTVPNTFCRDLTGITNHILVKKS